MRAIVVTTDPASEWLESVTDTLKLQNIWTDICHSGNLVLSTQKAASEIQGFGNTHAIAIVDPVLSKRFLSATESRQNPIVVLPTPSSESCAEYYNRTVIRLVSEQLTGQPNSILEHGKLELDMTQNHVIHHGKTVNLSNQQYMLLRYLMLNAGRLCTIDELMNVIRKDPKKPVDSQTLLRQLTSKINKELYGDAKSESLITNMPHRGLCFDAENFKFVVQNIGGFDFMSDGTIELFEQVLTSADNRKEPTPLGPKLDRLLRVVCESYCPNNPEHFASKEMIFEKTAIKNKVALRRAVSDLRKSIEDALRRAGKPSHEYIQTVFSGGLRFAPAPNDFKPGIDPTNTPAAER